MPNPLHLTSEEAEAILRLEDNPDYQMLVEHLNRRRTELLEKMTLARDSTELRILQGKAQELCDLMQLSHRSRTFSSLPTSRSP